MSFYAPALVAIVAALASACSSGRENASWLFFASASALAVLSASLGASEVAAALAAFVIAGAAMLRRERSNVTPDGQPALQAAERADPGDAAEVYLVPATPDDPAAPPRGSRAGGLSLVLAFFALAAHALAIARFPARASAMAATPTRLGPLVIPAVGLSHYLLASIALFTIGVVAVVLHRNRRAAWIGVGLMSLAAALALVAAAGFVGRAAEGGRLLATIVVVATAAAPAAAAHLGRLDLEEQVLRRFSNGLVGALLGVALALLTHTW